MTSRDLLCVLIVSVTWAGFADAKAEWVLWPVQDGGNGHWYQVVPAEDNVEGINWEAAKVAAEARGGYLATITSAQENAFVFQLVDDPQYWFSWPEGRSVGPWLGGFQPSGSPEPDGGWEWVTGETWGYTNWHPGEPNDTTKGNFLNFYSVTPFNPAPLWNDAGFHPPDPPRIAYVVETDSIACDFDSDGDCDADDADALTGVGNLHVGIPIPPAHPKFDLTNDNVVDSGDLTEWRQMVGVVNEFGGPVKPGDTNVDNDVDTDDLTRAIINYTGAGATTKVWSQGDNDGDGDTDTVDLTTAITNFTGVEAANPNVPDLIYEPATGEVTIDADGADVISFSLQGGAFNAADFNELPAGLTDNIASQIGWTSFNLFSGLTGAANLGAILPAGLDLAELEAALQIASYGLALSTGGGGGTFDLIIPEPASVMLIGLGATTLRRRKRAA